MANKNHMHLFILGSAAIVSMLALIVAAKFDASHLKDFGPTAQIYFSGIKNGLAASTAILFLSFISFLLFNRYLNKMQMHLKYFFTSLGNIQKNMLILAICLIFTFASHAGNIMNGYFNMDDFEIMGINHSVPLSQSILMPHGNDHTIPLFTAEMKALDAAFGQNPIPYNGFIFILFALIPFFTYLIFKRLGIGVKNFLVFLIIFSGATGWADMLTGFYIMSIYFQIILFFSMALWAYTAWTQSKEKKYMALFAVSIIFALTADISGIWAIPAIILFMAAIYYIKINTFTIGKKELLNFFKENEIPLFLVIGIVLIFAIFLIVTFTAIQPNTFLSALSDANVPSINEKAENWKLIPLASNFLSLFSFGVSLPIFAPNIVKILAHPAIKDSVKLYWPVAEIIILCGNAMLFWFAFKYAGIKERKLIILLAMIMFIAISMVIVTRPNHEAIPNFDYRYAGAAFYVYCIFITICVSLLAKTKKDCAAKIIIPIIIIIFAAQQAFSFQAVRMKEEAKLRKESIVRLNNGLLTELDILSKNKKDTPLVIPNLSGAHIFQPMPGYTLADYFLFFNKKMPIKLIQNAEMPPDAKTRTVATVSSLRESTSQEFKEALKKSRTISQYYFSSVLMTYKISDAGNDFAKSLVQNTEKEILIQDKEFDPEKIHTVKFLLCTDNASGNLELSFSFNNDFGTEKGAGKIRVDDYTHYILKDNKRLYYIETDLLQLYPYSLSERISNLTLYVPKVKKSFVNKIYFK